MITEQTRRRRWLAVGLGLVVAVAAFGLRFLTFRGLANDHYMHMAWAQQMLLGEVPGRDFVEPGMPLAVVLSALVQWVWRGPLSEGILSIAMLAASAGVTTVLVANLSRSVSAGVAAALLQVLLFARLYSFPKILVPAVALWLLLRYAKRPSTPALAALAAWTVAGFLLRHDLGVVAACAMAAGIMLVNAGNARAAASATGIYVLFGLAFVTPYLVFLQWTEGVLEHVRAAIEFGKSDTHQLLWQSAPSFPFLASGGLEGWTQADASAILFWSVYATLIVAAAVLAKRWRAAGNGAPVIAASLVFLLLYSLYVLRHPVAARLPDMAGVLTIPAAWTAVELARLAWARRGARPISSLALAASTAVLGAAIVAGTLTLRNIDEEIRRTNVARGWRGMEIRADRILQSSETPLWPGFWPAGEVPDAVGYLAACTAPTDRILITWPAPEYYFFAGRGFAAGHAWFLVPNAFISEKDQALMLRRLEAQSVPIALVNESRYDEFATALPHVADYLDRTYETVGTFVIRDGSQIAIRLRKGAEAAVVSRYGEQGWPCLTEPPTSQTSQYISQEPDNRGVVQ